MPHYLGLKAIRVMQDRRCWGVYCFHARRWGNRSFCEDRSVGCVPMHQQGGRGGTRSWQAALLLSCPWKKLLPRQVFPVFAPGLPVGPSTGLRVSLCPAPHGDGPALSAALCVRTDGGSGRGGTGLVSNVPIKPVSSQMLWNGSWPWHTSLPLPWMSGGTSDCFCSLPSPLGGASSPVILRL